MKKFGLLLAVLFMALAFAACAPGNAGGQGKNNGEDGFMTDEIFLTIKQNKIGVKTEKNSAAAALAELLREGDITYIADDFGGFEKVGELGRTLPHNDVRITTQPGDVVLYCGDKIVLFYGSNTWEYTRLGKIEGYTAEELKTLLCGGEGKVTITISLK